MADIRVCLVCGKDLSDVMGCFVFVVDDTVWLGLRHVPGLLCVEHGSNGANLLSAETYTRLTENV
jgi:hypothetical protein